MLWKLSPDWSAPVIERLEWKTDVLLAYGGSEQRVALRQTPRRSIEFGFLSGDATKRRVLEAQIWANGAQLWQLPIWTDATPSTAAISSGATTIFVDTNYRDFFAGGQALLLTDTSSLVVDIDSLTGSQLNISDPVVGNWPIETMIVPVRPAHLEPSQSVSRFTGDSVYGSARFLLDDISSVTPETPAATYRSYPVLTIPSNWTQDLTTEYQRKLDVVDFGNGGIYRDDESGLPVLVQSHVWALEGRAAIYAFRRWLYARRGRLNALWIPSFMPDVVLVALVDSSAVQLDVAFFGYSDLYVQAINRRDLRIELVDGSVFYRRIIASAVIDASTEQLTINSALGVDVAPGDVARISFMMLGRLDTDAIELAWYWGDYAEVKANFRSMNNDL